MISDDEELRNFCMGSDDDADPATRSGSPSSCEGNKGSLVKRPWTPEEDDALVAAVFKYGASRWSIIATHLSTGRAGKQCRERWNNHLCPNVKKSEWSEEDDRAILEGVTLLGTRWCEIIKVAVLAGRTDNAIKNRFYSLQRRMRSRQLGAKVVSPLSDDETKLAPIQRDRVVAIATELALATDEKDRDRLIEKLTSALQESSGTDDGMASELGIDSSDSPEEFESIFSDSTVEDSEPSLALLLPSASVGTQSSIRRARPIANIDTSCDSCSVGPPSIPTAASVVLMQQEPSPSYSSSGDSVITSVMEDIAMDCSIADSYNAVVPLTADGSRVESTFTSTFTGRLSQVGSPTGVTVSPSKRPWEETVATSMQRKQQQEELLAVGASLGGRHAYKALLAPLCIPGVGSDASGSPMKRLRTPTSCAPSFLSSGRGRTSSMHAATGTEESGAKVSPHSCGPTVGGEHVASPMSELLSLSFFNDLFSDLPICGLPSSQPPPSSEPFVAPPPPRPPIAVIAFAVAPASGRKRSRLSVARGGQIRVCSSQPADLAVDSPLPRRAHWQQPRRPTAHRRWRTPPLLG